MKALPWLSLLAIKRTFAPYLDYLAKFIDAEVFSQIYNKVKKNLFCV
jgi:hypothetical protein